MTFYLIPALVLAMLAYMFWSVAFRLRRDRLEHARKLDRGSLIFSRRHRIRYLLGRSFDVSSDEPEWQPALVSNLSAVDKAGASKQDGKSAV